MSVMLLPAVDEDDMQRYIVAKSNQFILHSRYDLTLMEQRILACMISMIDSRSDELCDCELDIDTFCSLCKIEKRGSSKYLKEVTKGLRDQSFWMETEEGVYETFSWVEKVSINEKKGRITLRFSRDMEPFLLNLQSDFTSYKLPMVLRFSSRYTNIVFDLIYSKFGQLGRKSGSLEISVEEMRSRVQIKKDKSSNKVVNQNITFKDLRVRILEPTIDEINKFTDIMIGADYVKKGRKVETIIFNFRKKTKEELKDVPPFSENRIDAL